MAHLEISAFSDLILRLLTCVEGQEIKKNLFKVNRKLESHIYSLKNSSPHSGSMSVA
jgi:hypothetical protein